MRAKESSDPPLSLFLFYLFPLSLTSCRTPLSQRLEQSTSQDGTKITLAAQAKYKVLSTICYEVKYFSPLV